MSNVLYRYEVRIGESKYGLFRLPQDTDLLDDEEYELYNEFYNELPFEDLDDYGDLEFYFTEYGVKMMMECWYLNSVIKAIPEEYGDDVELIRKEVNMNHIEDRIVYRDDYQVALSR